MAGVATAVATSRADSAAMAEKLKVSIRVRATVRDTETVPGQKRVLVPQSNHSHQGSNWQHFAWTRRNGKGSRVAHTHTFVACC